MLITGHKIRTSHPERKIKSKTCWCSDHSIQCPPFHCPFLGFSFSSCQYPHGFRQEEKEKPRPGFLPTGALRQICFLAFAISYSLFAITWLPPGYRFPHCRFLQCVW